MTVDRIASVRASRIVVPLGSDFKDAKVLTGRQKALTNVQLLVVEITTTDQARGMGFSYTLRVGGPAMHAYAAEIADSLIGEDPNDIARLWEKLAWRGASLGMSGLALQAIAAFDIALWDLKARKAGLPLSKLLGAFRESVQVYNSSGQYLSTDIGQMKESASASIASGIGGIKMKVGQPDLRMDLKRIEALRSHLGDRMPIMIDANQQWDRRTALQFSRMVDDMGLVFIEEPLDARDFEGHGNLAAAIATPIATGEMLTSEAEHQQLLAARGADFSQVDAARIGGITPFLRVMNRVASDGVGLAPHFVMEIHIHLAAVFPSETWVEHFEWLEPVFNERLEMSKGRMLVPKLDGLGLSLSNQARDWTIDTVDVEGGRP